MIKMSRSEALYVLKCNWDCSRVYPQHVIDKAQDVADQAINELGWKPADSIVDRIEALEEVERIPVRDRIANNRRFLDF